VDQRHKFKHTRPKPPKPGAVDGFISPARFKKPDTIEFKTRKRTGIDQTPRVDDFNRPDGYRSAGEAIAGTRDNEISAILSPAPRQRHQNHGETKKAGRLSRLKNANWRKIAKRGSLTLLVLLILVGGFLGFKVWRNTSKVFKGSIFGIFDTTKLKGEDKGRVTIMLTGTSEDDPGHAGADLTDSIILISIDTVHNNGFIMSIPRDLWVDYETRSCSVGYQGKINAVYKCGEEINFRQDGYPDGGVGLMEKVIEDNFGLDINYYTKINYTAFRDAVNSVGGIDVTIKTDDPRGLYDGNIARVDGGPLKLANGVQHLNGQTALNLARARCDTVCYGFARGDFDRTEHQRMMIMALRDKALSAGVLSNPAKISSLLDSVGNNVKTDFKTNEIRRLYDLSKKIPSSSVQSIGLADDNVKLVTTANINGTSAVRPIAGIADFAQIKAYIKRLTSNDPVVKEGATAVVLNGSGVSGLAKSQSNVLAEKGILVSAVANTTTRANTTIVFLNPKKSATNTYLSGLYKVTSTTDTVAYPEAKNYDADFVIILGTNFQASTNNSSTR
jgi:LCP family protein required for cell wall assembly